MKERILRMLMGAERYVSGQQLSETLGITRSAVWKHIKALREAGYAIESKTSAGYRLVHKPQGLNREELAIAIHGISEIFEKIVYLESAGSTNQVAKQMADRVSALIVADEQTAGRGRLGREWESESGQGIYMTFKLHPELLPVEAVHLTQLTALAVVRGLERCCGITLKIKWPNDVVHQGRKVAGILTEMTTEIERIEMLLIGIGVNVHQGHFDGELTGKATSLDMIQPEAVFDRIELIAAIVVAFETLYNEFLRDRSLMSVHQELNERSSLVGREIETVRGKERLRYRAVAIDESGQLVVEDARGRRETLLFGEVSVRGVSGYGE